jgi:flagellar hook-associated protein 2
MNTSQIISQLMQVEQAPQDRLKNKVTTAQTAVASYQSVNSKVATLQSAAHTLSQLGTWRSVKATSSSSSVTATASTNLNATAGSLTFDVTSLASKQTTSFTVPTNQDTDGDGKADTAVPITTATSVTVTPGTWDNTDPDNPVFTASGDPKVIDISADQTAAGIAKAITAAGAGCTAYVVNTGSTTGAMQITGTKSGAGNGFQITGLDGTGIGGTSPTSTYASSASLAVKGGGTNTYTVSSDTNTFTGLMAGVTVTVSKQETGVTIDASNDTGAISSAIQGLVDAANGALDEIGNQTAYDASTKQGSPLTGDFSVRNMSQQILSLISQGLSYDDPTWVRPAGDTTSKAPKIDFGSLKKLGVELDSTGHLSFNSSTFTSAYNADPATIQRAGMAFGDQTEATAKNMTINLTSVVMGRNSEIDRYNTQISDWDTRLSDKKQQLQKQYSDLEVSLGKLKNQQSWLSGQLSSLS